MGAFEFFDAVKSKERPTSLPYVLRIFILYFTKNYLFHALFAYHRLIISRSTFNKTDTLLYNLNVLVKTAYCYAC